VDVLIVAKAYSADVTWRCNTCATLTIRPKAPVWCPECRAVTFTRIDLKEEMVRLAEQSGATVEVVLHSPILLQLGGIGALLRYQVPAQALARLN
jgi:peptide subunit release factor 1 (eRF1)